MLAKSLLQRLVTGWDKRARVRSTVVTDIEYLEEKEDFIEDLLPFATHPIYQTAPHELRSRVLSCGWIVYNAKTISIETDIVNPVCVSIIQDKFNGTNDCMLKQLVTETMVDEAYHIHLCMYANEITKSARNLHLRLPTFSFVNQLETCKARYPEAWQKNLIQLATAITSEIYITDYLDLIHHTHTHIQPLNRLIVKTHRSDELAHGKIFTHLAHVIYHHLSLREKNFFARMMAQPLSWLVDAEFACWLSILEQIRFPNARQMIADCKSEHNTLASNLIRQNQGFQDLVHLKQQLGIPETSPLPPNP